jgi:branched-chain amino acid aminotransferase
MILPGVTRDSVLTLARDHVSGVKRLANLPDKLVVSERPVTMKEVKEASQHGSLVELFGAGNAMDLSNTSELTIRFSGTAAVISPVDKIGYLGEDVLIPTGEDGMGPVSRPIWKQLVSIQTGVIPSDWSVLVTE